MRERNRRKMRYAVRPLKNFKASAFLALMPHSFRPLTEGGPVGVKAILAPGQDVTPLRTLPLTPLYAGLNLNSQFENE